MPIIAEPEKRTDTPFEFICTITNNSWHPSQFAQTVQSSSDPRVIPGNHSFQICTRLRLTDPEQPFPICRERTIRRAIPYIGLISRSEYGNKNIRMKKAAIYPIKFFEQRCCLASHYPIQTPYGVLCLESDEAGVPCHLVTRSRYLHFAWNSTLASDAYFGQRRYRFPQESLQMPLGNER